MTNSILKIFKTIFIIILFFIYETLILFFLKKIGINLDNLNNNIIILIEVLINLSLMIIVYLFYRKDINSNIKDYFKNFKTYFKIGIVWWIIGLIIMYVSNIIIINYTGAIASNETQIIALVNKFPIYALFSSIIVAPFLEELVFRRSLRDIFTNDFLYVMCCGLIFGFIHIIAGFGDDFKTVQLLYIIPYGVFGSIFAYLYAKTKNIFVPMTFHLIHNSIIVLYYVFTLVK